MHEYSITRSLLDQALAETKRLGYKRINRIHLLLGESGGVVQECVQFYFDEMKKGTAAAKAELDFKRVPLRIRCPKCGAEWGMPDAAQATGPCPSPSVPVRPSPNYDSTTGSLDNILRGTCKCNAGGDIISGQELAIESMDVD